jgi:ribonucleoside-diphosphate reductase alpha chain
MPEYVRTVIVKAVPYVMESLTPKWYEGEWHETELFKFSREGDEEILRGIFEGTVYKIDKNRGLTREVTCEDYGVRYLKNLGEWDPNAEWATTTADLNVSDHVDDLKGFARWVDSAMSKTVNVPHDYPFEDFKDIYIEAYKSGYVKGVTTYRAGTMQAVLAAKDEVTAELTDEEIILDDYKVPNQSPATINTIRADGKKWYLTVILNAQETRPLALFVHTNHPEKNVTTHDATELLLQMARDKGIPERWVQDTEDKLNRDNNATRIARAISMCLRHGVLIKNIVAILDQVDDVYVGTFLFQVKKFLMTFLKEGEAVQNGDCPDCGTNNFIYSEGCIKCGDCGYSKCG